MAVQPPQLTSAAAQTAAASASAPGQAPRRAAAPARGQRSDTGTNRTGSGSPPAPSVTRLLWLPGRFPLLSSWAAAWGSHARCWPAIRRCGPWHPGSPGQRGDTEDLPSAWARSLPHWFLQCRTASGWLRLPPALGSPYRESRSAGCPDGAVSGGSPAEGTSLTGDEGMQEVGTCRSPVMPWQRGTAPGPGTARHRELCKTTRDRGSC